MVFQNSKSIFENIDLTSWRNQLAFWLLGTFNSFTYSVMLTAAHDILTTDEIHNKTEIRPDVRDCNILSTGSILLADILPALIITALSSILPFYPNVRIIIAVLLNIAGLLTIAFSTTTALVIFGVVLISLGMGLGEVTIIVYTSCFDKHAISAWSSGLGLSGLIASTTHATLMSFGIDPKIVMLGLIIIPILNGISFLFILTKPTPEMTETSEKEPTEIIVESEPNKNSNSLVLLLKSYMKQIPPLLKYAIPIYLMYLCQYFINLGLIELVEFDDIWIDHSSQYRWMQVCYQVAKLIGQSTGNFIFIDNILLMDFLQFLNVCILLVEVTFYIAPFVWIIFIITAWEGLLGGFFYVNAMRRISCEVSSEKRKFALLFATVFVMMGSSTAGFISFPLHNIICDLPKPIR